LRVADLAAVSLTAADAAAISVAGRALLLRRAWPRSTDRLLLEFVSDRGEIVPGQWLRDAGELENACAVTRRGASRPDRVRIVTIGTAEWRILLQTGGEDRVLRGLASMLEQTGTELIVHRPVRRAVVRCRAVDAATTFAKFLPQKRIAELVRREGLLRSASNESCFGMAPVVDIDSEAGMVRYAAAPGSSLHDLLPSVDEDVMRAVGRALRGLHEQSLPVGSLPTHGPAEEIGVLSRWMNHLRAFEPELGAQLEGEFQRIEARLRADSRERATIHRDFYDKQVFVDGPRITFLDFDTLALGDPALDVGNMIAHLEHRGAAAALANAFIDGYGDAAIALLPRIDTYRHAAHVRLRCVHAFRPPFMT
jgi:hypothetical protein